jgi:hypothetical protein
MYEQTDKYLLNVQGCALTPSGELGFIAMSSALRKVISLMTLMKQLHIIFLVHINKQNFFCKVNDDNRSKI